MLPENLFDPNFAALILNDDLPPKASGNDGVPPNQNFGSASSLPNPKANLSDHVKNILGSLDSLQFELRRRSQRLLNLIV